jgi:hypothetical protein
MLTLVVIPIEGVNSEKLIASFEGIECNVIVLGNERDFETPFIVSKWKLFMYADEILSEELNVAVPHFVKMGDADIYKIYKKVGDKISISPRMFKSGIELQKDCLMPVNLFQYRIDTILNGFIL